MAYEDQNPLDENIHERTLEDITLRLNGRKDIEKMNELFRDKMLPLRKKADYGKVAVSVFDWSSFGFRCRASGDTGAWCTLLSR